MTNFIQLHLLTSYPPANLNRDDLGRPKTAVFGGTQRLRVSSQSLKRAWRTSEVFHSRLAGSLGQRTKAIGDVAMKSLLEKGMGEEAARKAAQAMAGSFGKLDKKKSNATGQLVHFSPGENASIEALCTAITTGEFREPTKEELAGLLSEGHGATDIALFGRMLAEHPGNNVEAACQVAHALGVHSSVVEDDYFSAVDDLNTGEEDMGAGHIGELGYGAGLFYLYLCIDRDLLGKNLGGETDLIDATLSALVEAATTVSPRGKQNSFGSRAYASFVLAEMGEAQPRSLSVAFLQAVNDSDPLGCAIERLLSTRESFAKTYGDETRHSILDATRGEGGLKALIKFVCDSESPVC